MRLDFLKEYEFFAGVPDSLLRPLCDWLMDTYGISSRHVVAANEGAAVGLAAGYHLATGKVPVVYLQNSGIGNILNPVVSLLNGEVYGIPCLFVIGWRGEPGQPDEPQHRFQGQVTVELLRDMGIEPFVLSKDTSEKELSGVMRRFSALFSAGKQAALVVRKGALEYDGRVTYGNHYSLTREEALRQIAVAAGKDPVVSTTGKASRELFEIREMAGQTHATDFLTVGSMGHASSIALGIALQKPKRRLWLVDGDGALLMHMGSMATLGAASPGRLVHILLNNEAHETVGGMPTVAGGVDFLKIAEACGYSRCCRVKTPEELKEALLWAAEGETLTFLQIDCALGARSDLGRPTTSARENKENFMAYLQA